MSVQSFPLWPHRQRVIGWPRSRWLGSHKSDWMSAVWGPANQPCRKVQLQRWILNMSSLWARCQPPFPSQTVRTGQQLGYAQNLIKGAEKDLKKGQTNSRGPEHGESVTLLLCVLAELARNLSGLRKLFCQVLQNVLRKSLTWNTMICIIVLLQTHFCVKTLLQNCDQRLDPV